MGLDLYLSGTFRQGGKPTREVLEEIVADIGETFADEIDAHIDIYESEEGQPVIGIPAHAAAELAQVAIPERGRLECIARTNACGPGYHQFVVRLFEHVAKTLEATWDRADCEDDTGYFESRDRKVLEKAMLDWLQANCQGASEAMRETDADLSTAKFCLPMTNESYLLQGAVATPMGPRPFEWVHAVAADASKGKDFFAWWDEEFSAQVILNKALHLMWVEARWTTPVLEGDFQTLVHIHNLLTLAHEEDESLELPWAEWAEIISHLKAVGDDSDLEIDESLAAIVRAKTKGKKATIGFRRGKVVLHPASGWTLELPGEFTMLEGIEDEEDDDELGVTFVAGERMLNIACLELTEDSLNQQERIATEFGDPEARKLGRWNGESLVCAAYANDREDDEGNPITETQCFAVGPTQVLMCRCLGPTDESVDWILEIAKSVKHIPSEAVHEDDDED